MDSASPSVAASAVAPAAASEAAAATVAVQPPRAVRIYVDPLWIARPDLSLPRYLRAVPLARAYGTGVCLLLDGSQFFTEQLGRSSTGYLSDRERTLARHRVLVADITLRPKATQPQPPLAQPRQVLAVHVPTWDWDCLGGDVSLFTQSVQSVRGRTLLQRLGPSCMLSPFAVIDEQAMEADAAETVALALEAASTEALQRGKRAIVKLPTLGAALHLHTAHGLHVGPFAYRSFWQGVKLALSRCTFPGIAVLECSDKLGAANLAPDGELHLGTLKVSVPAEVRDISDFSGADPELLPCIIVPGSSFQMAGGLASFQLTLESALASTSDLSMRFSPLFNKDLVAQAALSAVRATQPAVVRPHWWPPQALRRIFNI